MLAYGINALTNKRTRRRLLKRYGCAPYFQFTFYSALPIKQLIGIHGFDLRLHLKEIHRMNGLIHETASSKNR